MATTVIYPNDTSVYTRVIDSTGLSEVHIDYGPSIILVLTGSWPVTSSAILFQGMDTGSLYPISCSWALQVVSASATTSASYAFSSSYAANAASATAINGTNPAYKFYASASMPFSSITAPDVVASVILSSSNAKADGSDIRVQWDDGAGNPSGSYIPAAIGILGQSGSSIIYKVSWSDTFVSNSIKQYVLTYGDPNANQMYFNQTQFGVLRKMGFQLGNYLVYTDSNQADWFSNDSWGGIGTRYLVNKDQTAVSFPTPSAYYFQGSTQVSFSVSSNGIFNYGAVSIATGIYSPLAPNNWGINSSDGYTPWVDVCVASDGWYIQYYGYRTFNVATTYYKAVLRYRNSGKFILSIFDNGSTFYGTYGSNTINGYINSQVFTFSSGQPITASNPSSAIALVIEPMALATTYGTELSYP